MEGGGWRIYQKAKHVNFTVSDSGLFLSTEHPYLKVSPDGLLTCQCCSAGGCETKALMRGKKIINTKTAFEQLQLLLTHEY